MSAVVGSKHKTLFLHWGPGGNAQVEREFFSNRPDVEFWDRPLSTEPTAYLDCIRATREHLELRFTEYGPIDLVAHSFGCSVALEITYQVPHLIRSLTLLSGSENLITGTYQLADRLIDRGLGGNDLISTLQAARRIGSWESFQSMIPALFMVPRLFEQYWGPDSLEIRAQYNAIAERKEVIDLPGFFAETEGYFHHRQKDQRSHSPFHGPVRLFVAQDDPYMRPELDIAAWKTRFPKLTAHIVPGGHFAQFEVSPGIWLP